MEKGTLYLASTWAIRTAMRMAREATREHHRPLVAVTYAATADNPNAIAFMECYLNRVFAGATVRRFAMHGEPAPIDVQRDGEDLLRCADVVFLAPGDPVRGASLLGQSETGAWIREAYARGAHCFGMSAGAILLGEWWASFAGALPGELLSGLGLVAGTILDCHDEDNGWPELRRVHRLARSRGFCAKAIGLPTGSGMIVAPNGTRFLGARIPDTLPNESEPNDSEARAAS